MLYVWICVCLCVCVHILIRDCMVSEPLPPVTPEAVVPEKVAPCAVSACGPSALCKPLDDGRETCTCPVGYEGNAYVECRPECTINSDCTLNLACINQRCIDPCPGTCGFNTQCHVLSHHPSCVCLPGYTGNPYSRCFPEPSKPPQMPLVFTLCYARLILHDARLCLLDH